MIGECTRLTSLSLNNNKLSVVPESIAMLTGLVKLGFGDNQFKLGTAWWLAALTCLQSLWLYNNLLIALPVAIGVLTNLDDLRVEGNPLKDPPASVVAKGLKAGATVVVVPCAPALALALLQQCRALYTPSRQGQLGCGAK
jgi:Leucine-rich repeat (LRR) protein